MDLGLLGDELGEDAAEAERVLAERGAHPVVAGGRRVALVEDQVDDLEHRRRGAARSSAPRGTSKGTRASASVRLARTMRWAIVGSGTRNARAISSVRQAAEQAQRERDARLGREHRVAGREHEAQEVVADVVVERRLESSARAASAGLELVAELLVLALEPRPRRSEVDRAVLGRGHEPGARVVRDA